jgi:hypothetical protein
MQLDELNPDIYILYSEKSSFSCQKIEKTEKTRGSKKLTYLEKTAYGSFIFINTTEIHFCLVLLVLIDKVELSAHTNRSKGRLFQCVRLKVEHD